MTTLARAEFHQFRGGEAEYLYLVPSAGVVRLDDTTRAVLNALGENQTPARELAARVASEEFAGGVLNLLSWPMMVLSGVFYSLDGAPRAVQVAAELFPLTHLLQAARAIMLEGAGLADLGYNVGALALMAVLFLAAGTALFRWTQD